jgi:hypothetical protein
MLGQKAFQGRDVSGVNVTYRFVEKRVDLHYQCSCDEGPILATVERLSSGASRASQSGVLVEMDSPFGEDRTTLL